MGYSQTQPGGGARFVQLTSTNEQAPPRLPINPYKKIRAEPEQAKIFEEFQQADSSITKARPS
jgi:hypothetical protein